MLKSYAFFFSSQWFLFLLQIYISNQKYPIYLNNHQDKIQFYFTNVSKTHPPFIVLWVPNISVNREAALFISYTLKVRKKSATNNKLMPPGYNNQKSIDSDGLRPALQNSLFSI